MDRAIYLRLGDHSQRGFPRNPDLPPPLGVDAEAGSIADSDFCSWIARNCCDWSYTREQPLMARDALLTGWLQATPHGFKNFVS